MRKFATVTVAYLMAMTAQAMPSPGRPGLNALHATWAASGHLTAHGILFKPRVTPTAMAPGKVPLSARFQLNATNPNMASRASA
jgi:hypothetical protein